MTIKQRISGFHHISMRVKNLSATLRFYCDGLECEAKHRWGEGKKETVLIHVGGGSYLEASEGEADATHINGVLAHIALRTDDIDEAVERARAVGATVTREAGDIDLPADPVIPVRVAFVEGPDGEVVEFFQDDVT